nr:MAG TPA: hypothetical protein [Caudoviricetes sp.]
MFYLGNLHGETISIILNLCLSRRTKRTGPIQSAKT